MDKLNIIDVPTATPAWHLGIKAGEEVAGKAGLAGVRIDDQPIEHKRGTGTAGMEVESLEVVLARYRAAVDRQRELEEISARAEPARS